MSFVADSLGKSDSYVWGNIFSPCEIIGSFGLNTLSIECLACYFSGYHLRIILLILPRIPGSRLRFAPIIKLSWELSTAELCPCRNTRSQPLCPATET